MWQDHRTAHLTAGPSPEAFALLPPISGSRHRVAGSAGRKLLPRINDSTPRETWGFRAPPPAPPRGALAFGPRPRPTSSCPSGRVRVSVAPAGRVRGLRQRPLRRLPASAAAKKATSREGDRPILWLSRKPLWRCQLVRAELRGTPGGSASPSAPGRPHTCLSVTSARAPGACVSCRSRSGWARTLRTRTPPEEGTALPRSPVSVDHSGRRREDRRAPGAGRVRARFPSWAPWRCPGAGHPRGAHRLDLGGPAAGRRPQVHGGLGAR